MPDVDSLQMQHPARAHLESVTTIREIASTYGIHRQTVWNAINSGDLYARQSGTTWLIRRVDAHDRWGQIK